MYRQERFPLQFASSALAPDGATRSYTLRERAQNGKVDYEAVCVIPATRAAADPYNPCPGGCTLEPIIVIGEPGGGGGGGDECGYFGCYDQSYGDGGGGGYDPGTPSDPNEDRSQEWDGSGELLDCPKPGTGYGSSGYTQDHCDQIDKAIYELQIHPNDQCKTFGRSAEHHYRAGKSYFYWTNAKPGTYGGYLNGSVGLTPRAFEPGQLGNTIAHEESHRLGWPDRYIDVGGTQQQQEPGPGGLYADDWGSICRGKT